MTLYKCAGPGPVAAYNGVETIELDEEYYFFQIFNGITAEGEEAIKNGYFVTKEGFRVEFKALDEPMVLSHTRVRIENIEKGDKKL